MTGKGREGGGWALVWGLVALPLRQRFALPPPRDELGEELFGRLFRSAA